MGKPNINSNIITFKEKEALVQFKKRIPDILENLSEYKSHDLWLLHWLRAKELNIKKSEEMLKKSLEWRAAENIDGIFDWKIPEFVEEEFPMQAPGFDKDGRVIAIIPFGRWDVRKAVSKGFKSDFIRYVDLLFEQANEFCEHKSTKDAMITKFVLVLDFGGFSLKQFSSKETIDCILDTVRRFEANHPEALKTAWVVNAPNLFKILFSLIKPLVTARAVRKVRAYGSNTQQWRAKLLENIEPDQLPSQYGGTNTSCRNYKVTYGFDLSPNYEVFPEDEFIPVTIDAGGKHEINFTLQKDSKVSWNFQTADYDIGLSLIYSSSSEEKNETDVLFTTLRADSHLYLQKGGFVAEIPGRYSLVFDNSYSRLRGKSLRYCARVK